MMTHHTNRAVTLAASLSLSALTLLAGACGSTGTAHTDARTNTHAHPSEVFPSTYVSYSGASGMSTSPDFSMYGELPNGRAGRHASALPYEAVENMQQVSFTAIGADFDPVVSRDGQWIYYASTQHKPTADIYVKSVDGSSLVQLTSDPAHDVNPALSPDGNRIAFASNRHGSWDIHVMNADGGQAIQLTSDSSQELHPTWSPDGKQIAYCRLGEVSGRWEIWISEIDRPAVKRFITFGLFPEWHPTDNMLVFQRSRERGDRYFSVWTIELENGEGVTPTEIASSPVAAVINPSWSPNGEWIAFATVFNPPAVDEPRRPDYADVWICKADGTARANLTGGRFLNVMPSWGPDNTVFFISDRTGYDNVWSIGASDAILASGGPPASGTDFANAPTGD